MCAYRSCKLGTITNISNIIEARGRDSISTVTNFNGLVLTGEKNCGEGCVIRNGYYLGCFGSRNCRNATISNVEFIVGAGYRVFRDSNITSSDDSQFNGNSVNMSVYLLSDQAGIESHITCNNGDNCAVYAWNDDIYHDIGHLSCRNCSHFIVYIITTQEQLVIIPTTEPTNMPTSVFMCFFLVVWFSVCNTNKNNPVIVVVL